MYFEADTSPISFSMALPVTLLFCPPLAPWVVRGGVWGGIAPLLHCNTSRGCVESLREKEVSLGGREEEGGGALPTSPPPPSHLPPLCPPVSLEAERLTTLLVARSYEREQGIREVGPSRDTPPVP